MPCIFQSLGDSTGAICPFEPRNSFTVTPRVQDVSGRYLDRVELLHEFAHLIQPRVQFPKVARTIATSIFLLTVLLTGIIAPTGVCALMCERHSRAASQRHCSEPSDAMPGMVHDHSAMNPRGVEATSPMLVSQSCRSNCVTAERLNVSRKVVPQVTVVKSGLVVLATAAGYLMPDPARAWSSDNSPPSLPSASAASFRILRI